MRFGNRSGQSGQMTVELAVCIPVLLAVMGVAVNLMVFLGDCARFDRLAAEAVRVEAASPGYGRYSTAARVDAVESLLSSCFAQQEHLSIRVQASAGTTGESTRDDQGEQQNNELGAAFSLEPHHETYACTLSYLPWGFGDSFFGIRFSGITHTRSYTIDPFRPGVLL